MEDSNLIILKAWTYELQYLLITFERLRVCTFVLNPCDPQKRLIPDT